MKIKKKRYFELTQEEKKKIRKQVSEPRWDRQRVSREFNITVSAVNLCCGATFQSEV
jgi:hypothetical protein